MRTAKPIVAALAAALAIMHPAPAEAQSQRPLRELAGSVAVEVWGQRSGTEQSRACWADLEDSIRIASAILLRTRLVVFDYGANFRSQHPEHRRLKALLDVAEALVPPAGAPGWIAAYEAAELARRNFWPWQNPLMLMIHSDTLRTNAGTCVENLTVEVSASIEPTRIMSSRTDTTSTTMIVPFIRSTLLVGVPEAIRQERRVAIERLVREFARAWVEANR